MAKEKLEEKIRKYRIIIEGGKPNDESVREQVIKELGTNIEIIKWKEERVFYQDRLALWNGMISHRVAIIDVNYREK